MGWLQDAEAARTAREPGSAMSTCLTRRSLLVTSATRPGASAKTPDIDFTMAAAHRLGDQRQLQARGATLERSAWATLGRETPAERPDRSHGMHASSSKLTGFA